MKFITDLRLLLLGGWLGAAIFFVAIAQTAFALLPERELAGALVGRTLSLLNFAGLAVAFLVFVLSLANRARSGTILVWAERAMAILLAIACALGQFVTGILISSIRSQMGGRPIDEFAIDDPLRVRFNELHEYSTWILAIAMIAALVGFFAVSVRNTDSAVNTDFSDS
ncbi:MAG: hypothetical protein C4325_11225 [Blastocatellia bacterium]